MQGESFGLLKEPWTNIVLNGQPHLIKFLTSNNEDQREGYTVAVTDLIAMWIESQSKDELVNRNQDLNPNLEISVSRLIQNIQSLVVGQLKDAKNITYDRSTPGGTLRIEVTSFLSELPFKWKFSCTAVPAEKFSEHVVLPMFHLAAEQQAREQELLLIMKRKDSEIMDYKANGATVSRKHLATEPFDSSMFDQQVGGKRKNADDSVESASGEVLGPAGQELYRLVMARVLSRKRSAEPTTDVEAPVAVSASRGDDNKTITVKAEDKHENPEEAQKEEELQRRQVLEQKLAQQQQKLRAKAQAKKKMKF